MGSESSEPTEPEPVARRPMSRRRKRKLLVALIVIVAAVIVVFWGWSSTGGNFVSVSSLVGDPSHFTGQTIEIRGIVSGWDGDPGSRNFTMTDSSSSLGKSLNVSMAGTLPSGFENGKTVNVKGQIDDLHPLHFTASEMTVGCASKY